MKNKLHYSLFLLAILFIFCGCVETYTAATPVESEVNTIKGNCQ